MAISREIADLLVPQNGEHPGKIEVSLSDPRFAQIHRVQSDLAINRKRLDLYKGRLCVRGDTVPLRRRLIGRFAIGIYQAFLRPSNLNQRDRVIAITPPPTIQLPRR